MVFQTSGSNSKVIEHLCLNSLVTLSLTAIKSKVDGPWRLNWTIQTAEIEWSFIKLDGPKDSTWTVLKSKRGQ